MRLQRAQSGGAPRLPGSGGRGSDRRPRARVRARGGGGRACARRPIAGDLADRARGSFLPPSRHPHNGTSPREPCSHAALRALVRHWFDYVPSSLAASDCISAQPIEPTPPASAGTSTSSVAAANGNVASSNVTAARCRSIAPSPRAVIGASSAAATASASAAAATRAICLGFAMRAGPIPSVSRRIRNATRAAEPCGEIAAGSAPPPACTRHTP